MELADFMGTWQLSRRITHGDGSVARFDEQAEFTPDGIGLRLRGQRKKYRMLSHYLRA